MNKLTPHQLGVLKYCRIQYRHSMERGDDWDKWANEDIALLFSIIDTLMPTDQPQPSAAPPAPVAEPKLSLRDIDLLSNLATGCKLLANGVLVQDGYEVGKVFHATMEALYERGYIDTKRQITDAGRAALVAADGEAGQP